MRSLLTIIALVMLLAPASLRAQDQTLVALQQGEARLAELDDARAEMASREQRLERSLGQLAAALKRAPAGGHSELGRAEVKRIRSRARSVERERRQAARARGELNRQAAAELGTLLALYESALARQPRAELHQRYELLRLRAGFDSDRPTDPVSLKQQAAQAREAEAQLRYKARRVAQKIRQLRRQRELAGDVMRSVRDQALFDEEERRLELSRVVTHTEVNSELPQDSDAPVNLSGDPSPGSGGNAPPPADNGDSDGVVGSYDGDDGSSTFEPSGEMAEGRGGTPDLGETRGSTTLIQELVSGSRVNSLLEQDVESLLGGPGAIGAGGLDEDMVRLEALRRELLLSADRLSKQRQKLEVEARSPRR